MIQLAPEFAPVHVANIRALAKGGWWSGAAIYRVQDNYVVQWGNNESDKPLPAGVVAKPPAEYHRALKGLGGDAARLRRRLCAERGLRAGWPVAYDAKAGTANLAHCYGYVGVGRDLSPDTGTGGELYAVIGHAPRHLDRNIAVVGRVIEGIDRLSSLPRGTEALGFYKERKPARADRDGPAGERDPGRRAPGVSNIMDTGSATFGAYLKARANRKDDFFIRPAGGVDLCNVAVPVRSKPSLRFRPPRRRRGDADSCAG